MRLYPVTGSSQFATIGATAVEAATGMVLGQDYVLASTTNCFIRQGTALKITCTTQANMADTDFITITVKGTAVVYEFDKAGNGVTAGRVQVNISADTTAAQVAARLRTAILANQTTLRVIDPTDGTLQVDLSDSRSLTITENVANAAFTITAGVMQVSAAAGSMFVPSGLSVMLDPVLGAQVGILQETAAGKSTVTLSRMP